MYTCTYVCMHIFIYLGSFYCYVYLCVPCVVLIIFIFHLQMGEKNPINNVVAPSTFHTKCTPLCGFESVPSQGILYLKPTFNTIQITD